MSKSYKHVTVEDSISGALSAAVNEVRELTEEMTEWRDNMDGSGLENTEKFSMVEAAADSLESADVDAIEELPDLEDDDDVPIDLDDSITVTLLQNKNKRRSNARWARLSNAVSYLEVAKGALENKHSGLRSRAEDLEVTLNAMSEDHDERDALEREHDEAEERASTVEEFITEIESVIDELANVEFPGMFG